MDELVSPTWRNTPMGDRRPDGRTRVPDVEKHAPIRLTAWCTTCTTRGVCRLKSSSPIALDKFTLSRKCPDWAASVET